MRRTGFLEASEAGFTGFMGFSGLGSCLNCDLWDLWDLRDRWETMKGFFITNRLVRLSDEKQIGRGIRGHHRFITKG